MGIKEKLFGGIQNQPQQKVADNIVNPQYNINPDGSVNTGNAPVPVQNPFMQNAPQMNFGAPQQNPYMQQPDQNYPVLDNNQQFTMQQPNEPNAYFTGTPTAPEGYQQQGAQYNAPEGYQQQAPQYNAPEGYQQQVPQYNAPEGYQQQAPQYNAPEGYQQQAPQYNIPQGFDPNGGNNNGNGGF